MATTIKSAFTGQQLVDIASTRLGETYIFGAPVPKNDANYHGPWDCAELVSWTIFQATGQLYGCLSDVGNPATADAYTGYFNRDANTIGTKISVAQAAKTPGAILLRKPTVALGGHIVLSDGKGGTIEARGHAYGVVKYVVDGRRWDTGILIPWIDYTKMPNIVVTPPSTVIYKLAKPFMKNAKIGEIQKALNSKGFNTFGIDNVYGVNTANAVQAFQQRYGLTPDGEVGAITAGLLGVQL